MRRKIIEEDPLYKLRKSGCLGYNGKWYCLHHTFINEKKEADVLNKIYCFGLWLTIAIMNIKYSSLLIGIDVTLWIIKIVGEHLFLKPIFTGKVTGYYKYFYKNKDRFHICLFYYLFYGASLRVLVPFLWFIYKCRGFNLNLLLYYFKDSGIYMLISLLPFALYYSWFVIKMLRTVNIVSIKDYSDFVLTQIITKSSSDIEIAGLRFEQNAYVSQFKHGIRNLEYVPPYADTLLKEAGEDWRKESLEKLKSDNKNMVAKKNKIDNVIYLYKK